MIPNQPRATISSSVDKRVIRLLTCILLLFSVSSVRCFAQQNAVDSTTFEYAIAQYQLLGLHESAIYIHYEDDPVVENFGSKFNLKIAGNSMKNVKVIFKLLHYMNQKGFTLATSEYVGKYPSDVTEYIFVRRKRS